MQYLECSGKELHAARVQKVGQRRPKLSKVHYHLPHSPYMSHDLPHHLPPSPCLPD